MFQMPIDIDFSTLPQFATGCLPRTDRLGDGFPVLEDQPHFQVLTRAERRELFPLRTSMKPLVGKIKNQKQEGSCASNAALKALEILMAFQGGLENAVEMSAMSLYKRVGDNAQSGSNIGDNLRELVERGALPVDNAENRARFAHVHPATGFGVRLPDKWEETAALFTLVEWFDIRSWDGLQSALYYDYPVCYGRAGHAICGVDPYVDESGDEFIDYANSWDETWGDDGFGRDSERAVAAAIEPYGAWCARLVTFVANNPLPRLRQNR